MFRPARRVEPIYEDLRRQVLALDPTTVGLHPSPEHPRVWGALMEIGYPEGVATFVMLADGTTSLYTSSGGGTIGGGMHEAVASRTAAFLRALDEHLDRFTPDATDALPAPGDVVFRALTYDGRLAASAREDDLGEGRHPLSGLFYAGHDVITQLRLIEEQRPEDP